MIGATRTDDGGRCLVNGSATLARSRLPLRSLETSVFSANLYCHGAVDQALRELILPFWQTLRGCHPGAELWLVRYAKGGEHLKIRLFAESGTAALAARLEAAAQEFLAAVPMASDGLRDPARDLPAIDPEDGGGELRTDRTWLRTRYRYRPEHVGAEPLSAAAGFGAIHQRCRVAATAVLLDWLERHADAEATPGRRLVLATRLLATGVAAAHPAATDQARAFTFQRDWLLRVVADPRGARVLFECKTAERPADAGFARAAQAVDSAPLAEWHAAIAALAAFGADWCRARGEEPASAALVELAVCRLIHNGVNLIGIGLSNEAYLCHRLAASRAAEEATA